MGGAELPEAKSSGIKDSNGLFSEMNTAHDWNKTPDEWYEASRAARAMMIATCAMRARVESAVMNNGNK